MRQRSRRRLVVSAFAVLVAVWGTIASVGFPSLDLVPLAAGDDRVKLSWKVLPYWDGDWMAPGYDDAAWAKAWMLDEPLTAPWNGAFTEGAPASGSWIWKHDARQDWSACCWDSAAFRATFLADSPRYRLSITADDYYYLYVDGEYRGGGWSWQQLDHYDLELTPGTEHLIAVFSYNQSGPAGVFVDLERLPPPVEVEWEQMLLWSSNGDYNPWPWDWAAVESDEQGWAPAVVISEPCTAPWYCSFDGGGTQRGEWLWSRDTRDEWSSAVSDYYLFRGKFFADNDAYRIRITADDYYVLYVDGFYYDYNTSWQQVHELDVSLTPGESHVISVLAANWGGQAGVFFDIERSGTPWLPAPSEPVSSSPPVLAASTVDDPRCVDLLPPRQVLETYRLLVEREAWTEAVSMLDAFQRVLLCQSHRETMRLQRELGEALRLAADNVQRAKLTAYKQTACEQLNALLNPGLLVDDLTACQGGLDVYDALRDPLVLDAGRTCEEHYPSHRLGLWAYDVHKATMVSSSLMRDSTTVATVITKFWNEFPNPLNRGYCCSLADMLADGFVCGRGVTSCDLDDLSNRDGGPSSIAMSILAQGATPDFSDMVNQAMLPPEMRAFGSSRAEIAENFCASRGAIPGQKDVPGGLSGAGVGDASLNTAQCIMSAMGRPMLSATGKLFNMAPGMNCLPNYGRADPFAPLPPLGGVMDPGCSAPADGESTKTNDQKREDAEKKNDPNADRSHVDQVKSWLSQQVAEENKDAVENAITMVVDDPAEVCGAGAVACYIPPPEGSEAGTPGYVVISTADSAGTGKDSTDTIIHELLHAVEDSVGELKDGKSTAANHDAIRRIAGEAAKKFDATHPRPKGQPAGDDGWPVPGGGDNCSATAERTQRLETCAKALGAVNPDGSEPQVPTLDPYIYTTGDDPSITGLDACDAYSPAPTFVRQCESLMRCSENNASCCHTGVITPWHCEGENAAQCVDECHKRNAENPGSCVLDNEMSVGPSQETCWVMDPPPEECAFWGMHIPPPNPDTGIWPSTGTTTPPAPPNSTDSIGLLWDGTTIIADDVTWTGTDTFTLDEPTASLSAGTTLKIDGSRITREDTQTGSWVPFGDLR